MINKKLIDFQDLKEAVIRLHIKPFIRLGFKNNKKDNSKQEWIQCKN